MKIFNYRLGTRLSLTDQKWNSLVKAGAQEACHQKIWTNQRRALRSLCFSKMAQRSVYVTLCGGQGFRGISARLRRWVGASSTKG